MRLLLFVTLIACLGLTEVASSQTPSTITGRILGPSQEPVPGVVVTLLRPGTDTRGVLSDANGIFRFVGILPGTYTIRTQHLAYAQAEIEVDVGSAPPGIIEITLEASALELQGVVAQGRRETNRERSRFESEPGVTARVVEAEALKVIPGLAEPDVLRAIELLPGVISTSDFSSSFSVRGGATDQNLVLIDGFTVFNPVHLGGLFSVFNSDAVDRAELFAGGFGAEFGGRVSSVLNIESRDEVPDGVEVAGGVSMLATRVLARAPLPGAIPDLLGGDSGHLSLSARRSYFDAILRPVVDFPYHLTDLQGHASIGTFGGGTLAFTGYWGEDVLDLSNLSADEGSAADALRLKWSWGNRVAGIHWTQPLAGGWLSELRLGKSSFADDLTFVEFGDIRFSGSVDQYILRGDLGKDFSQAFSISTGISAERLEHANLAQGGGTTFFKADGEGDLVAGYTSLQWRPNRWIIEPGIRLDSWLASDTTMHVLSPRFSAKRFLGAEQNTAIKFAIGRYSQFLHSLKDDELPVSNDTWVLADRYTPAIISDQVQLGVETFVGEEWSGSIEGYYRLFDGVTENNFADNPNDPGDDLLDGEGKSYGLDVLLRRLEGDLTGWLALSLLRAEREMPDPYSAVFDDLPPTVKYPPIYDRRFNVDLVLQYETSGGLEMGARWNFGSGLPYTRPIAQHFAWSYDPITGGADAGTGFEDADFPLGIILSDRNSQRYPAYHRLDLTVRKPFERRWGNFIPYLQILNAYNQENVLFYFYDYGAEPAVRSGFTMFPLLPTVGLEVTF